MGGLHHSVLGSSRLTNPADNPPKDREILSRGWGPSQSSNTHLHLLEFVDRRALPTELKKLLRITKGRVGIGRPDPTQQAEEELTAYFSGRHSTFATRLALIGSAFSRQVWGELRRIPVGETRSYTELAHRVGKPAAVRAVARANGANQIALMIPCHRVIGADGSLTGYEGGL